MQADLDYVEAFAALDWQIELGATEAIGDEPLNRYEETPEAAKPAAKAAPAIVRAPAPEGAPVAEPGGDATLSQAVQAARAMAAAAGDLASLKAAMAGYEFCDLKKGARNLVFADGQPGARLMIIGEAPGRDEDIAGKPFVGRAGQLLDRMLAAIGMARDQDGDGAVYIANVLPWRPPQNRDPNADEIAMLLPFLKRHVELAGPDMLLPMGNAACQALLGQAGITRLRGNWTTALGLPALPMFHPAYLLRSPEKKREAWADLLAVKAWLRDGGVPPGN
ncbi:MAG: uracil-DNA glycosylase [Rhodobacteraceae bacterium]|nr:uracil-DNA glycosylase [Paracoccaceae bacterium]